MARNYYSHDNFVYNMNESGYSNMTKALEDYIRSIENERVVKTKEKGISNLVQEDPSILR